MTDEDFCETSISLVADPKKAITITESSATMLKTITKAAPLRPASPLFLKFEREVMVGADI